jgi:predicted transglutaminase-like cysteine proteinase
MRQTAHLYTATAAAAVVMCCSLPYATRANLNYAYRPEGTVVSVYEMAAAAPMQFVDFPRTLDPVGMAPSVNLSVTTLRGFVALTKGLRADARWPDVGTSAIVSNAAKEPTKIIDNNQDPVVSLPKQMEANVDRIAFSTPVLAPAAFVRFCARYPEDCKVSPTEFSHTAVSLTKDRLAELSKVNRDVNHSIKPQENLGGVMAEQWLVAPRHGDCNDYAVTKRHELLARGWPSHSLLLAEVEVAWGEHHLLLVVRTSEDDLVLDNLKSDVRPASQVTYRWVRAQQTENPKFWSAINVARSDRVATNAR